MGMAIYASNSNASIRLLTDAADTGNDPHITFTTSGAANWYAGVDNSDSDKFKIGDSDDPSDGVDNLVITTAGDVGIGIATPGAKLTIVDNDTFNIDGFQTAAFAAGRDAFWFDPGGDTLFVKNNGTVRFILTTAYSGSGH